MTNKPIGRVWHYFSRVGVAAIDLSGTLRVGDVIHILGSTTDFRQRVASMEEEHVAIEVAEKGHSVGIRIAQRARHGDKVYKVASGE